MVCRGWAVGVRGGGGGGVFCLYLGTSRPLLLLPGPSPKSPSHKARREPKHCCRLLSAFFKCFARTRLFVWRHRVTSQKRHRCPNHPSLHPIPLMFALCKSSMKSNKKNKNTTHAPMLQFHQVTRWWRRSSTASQLSAKEPASGNGATFFKRPAELFHTFLTA